MMARMVMAMVTATRVVGKKMVTTWGIASGRRVAGNKESDGEGGKGGGDNNEVGHGNGNNMDDGHRDEGGGH